MDNGEIRGTGKIGVIYSLGEMYILDKNVSLLNLLSICGLLQIFSQQKNLEHLQSVVSIVEDVCTLKCLQWCSIQQNLKIQ